MSNDGTIKRLHEIAKRNAIIAYFVLAFMIFLLATFVGRFFTLRDNVTLVLFAIPLALMALGFPYWTKLESRYVDLWYYSIGIVVVIGLFGASEAEVKRQKLGLAENYQRLSVEKSKREGVVAVIRHMIEDPEEIFQQVRILSGRIAERRRSYMVEICSRAGPLAGSIGNRMKQAPDFIPEQAAYAAECASLMDRRPEDDWLRLSKLASLDKLSSFDLDTLDSSDVVTIDRVEVPIKQVLSDLVLSISDATRLHDKLARAESSVAETANEIEGKRKQFEKPERIEDMLGLWATFAQNWWPYMLISLLGLKIARNRHFS